LTGTIRPHLINQSWDEVVRVIASIRTRIISPSFHDLSRFLCFGKEGKLRGREFEDQLHSFSCLAILQKAVVAWNLKHTPPGLDE
jgi:TnpA family transposase